MLARDYRQRAWDALSGNWGTMALITLVYAVITGVCGMLPGVGSVASLVIGGPLTLALALMSLRLLGAEKVGVENLFDGFRDGKFLPSFLLSLVNSIFIALWSLLFVIPGIVKSYAYSMSMYILAENPNMSQSECRAESMRMMVGHKWRLFCLHFSFIGWMLLSSLTFGILMFWVLPYMRTAEAAFYEDLKSRKLAA